MIGALLTDLYKVCDCILKDILIAKLSAYVFGYNLCKCCNATSQQMKQRIKINVVYSKYCEISVKVSRLTHKSLY